MMLKKGDAIIAGDSNLKDKYYCIMQEDSGAIYTECVLCKVKRVIDYPIQHAISDVETVHENHPLLEDGVYRLTFYKKLEGIELESLNRLTYSESLRLSIMKALRIQNAQIDANDKLIVILNRHLFGEMPQFKRSLLNI